MRGLVVPDVSEDFTADPVELFFDLAYVFAFSQIVAILLDHPTWDAVGESALIFLLLWMPWSQLTWSANAVAGNSRPARLLFLLATAASVPMAASIQTAFDASGALFAIPLAVIFLSALAMMLIGVETGSDTFRSAVRYATPSTLAMVLIVVGGFLDGDARVGAWIIGIAVFTYGTIKAGGSTWIIRAGHFAERHALIIIVALGEVIVALGNSVAIPLRNEGGFPANSVIALVAAGLLAGVLWWAYFDRVQPAFEHRADSLEAVERGRFARDVYTYVHAPIVAGIILIAVAMEEMALHPSDPLPAAFRAMGFGGLLFYFGGVGIGVYRSYQAIAVERVAAIAAIGLLLLFGSKISGVVLLVAIVVILVATLAVEHIRIETPRSATE
jgi:low temperature requirement protein LtrA